MREFGLRDAVELLIFWIGIYLLLRSLKGTRGLGVLKGTITFIMVLYVGSKVLEEYLNISLSRLTFVIESLAPYALVAFVVVFQPEVRRGLTRLGERPFGLLSGRAAQAGVTQQIAEACGRMARRRRGALIVVERSIGFRSILESGQTISAELSGPLLEAIFEPSGPLHDGAVVVRGNTIIAASCLLPLSDDPNLDPQLGTRHRAALGLADETDAAIVIVSEETGRISLAYRGRMRTMRDVKELTLTLNGILDGLEPIWATETGTQDKDKEPSADSRKLSGSSSRIFAPSDPGRGSGTFERPPDPNRPSTVFERPAEAAEAKEKERAP